MKKYIIAILTLAVSFGLKAQGTLPMYFDCNSNINPPTGWTLSQGATGNFTYSTAAFVKSAPNALRFDLTGEYALAYWSGKADTITYWMSGTAAAGVTTWTGNVTVDESIDGSSWSTVKDHLNDLGVSTKMYSIRVKPSSRYVRFYYKSKASGFNLAIDDVTINPAPAGDAPELQVSYNGKKLIHNSTVKTGNDTLIQLKVLNNSKAAELNISDIQLTGSQNTFFKLLNVAQMKIAAGDSAIVQVKLNATAEGTYNVNVTFTSNDTLNNPFTVILSTIKGQFASQPTLQPTALDVTAKAWRMNGKFTVAVGAESYLVVCSKGSSTDVPVDGAQYQRGEYIGNSRVIYVGTNNANIDFDNIVANTNYVVRVFSFNGYGAYTNYLTTAPLSQSITTPGLLSGPYYGSLTSADTMLVAKLKAIVRPHRQIYYSNFASYIINNFEARDTTEGKQILSCFYSGYHYKYTPPFKFDTMSREHSYPSSWMGESSQDSFNYSDLHILFPVNQNKVNAVRSNYPLNNLKSVTTSFYGGKFGTDSAGEFAYEPRDFAKGTAARANFYVCATYNRPGKAFTIPTDNQFLGANQDQNVLKRWNKKYPPTNWEIARMEYIAQSSVQNNRNPFIDNPDWACFIDFRDMTYIKGGDCGEPKPSSAVKTSKTLNVNVFPNPSSQNIHVDMSAFNGQQVNVSVFDFYERTVFETSTSSKSLNIDSKNWANGNYLLLIRSNNGLTAAQNIVKQ
jgi:hypothetical protein